MPDRTVIDRFLDQRHVAFVGVSRDSRQFANAVYRALRDGGRTMYPVNEQAGGEPVEGDASYQRLASVPDPLDGVVVMVPAPIVGDVVRAAIRRGVPRIWLHAGIGSSCVTDEAVELCRQHGVEVVDGACPMMFLEPVRGFHRVHRWVARRRFAAGASSGQATSG